MPVVNLKQMKLNEPTRNFDESVDANVNIPAENDQGQFGAFKFFTGVKTFFKGISALGTLASGSRLPVTDINGNVTYTTMNDINNYVVNNALANYTEKGTSTVPDFNAIIPTQLISTRFDVGYNAQNMPDVSGSWVVQTSRRNNNLVQIAKRMSSTLTTNIYTRSGTVSDNIATWSNWEKITTETDLLNVPITYKSNANDCVPTTSDKKSTFCVLAGGENLPTTSGTAHYIIESVRAKTSSGTEFVMQNAINFDNNTMYIRRAVYNGSSWSFNAWK